MSTPLRARLTVVVAAAGYGKTTAVHQWVRTAGTRVQVVEDAHRAPEQLVPEPGAQLVLLSRWPLPAATLLRHGLGAPVELGPRSLALSPRQVARLLADRYGLDSAGLADSVHQHTAGWPALVDLVGAALAPGLADSAPDALAADGQLAAAGTPLYDYLCGEVLDDLPDEAAEVLGSVAELGAVSAELAAAVGHERAAASLALLARIGLLLPAVPGRDWYRPVPVVAQVVRARAPLSAARRKVVIALAAEWHTDHHRPADALRLALASADQVRCARLLIEHGPALLADGAAADIAAAAQGLPAGLHCADIDLLHADALQATGDTAGAIAGYARLAGTAQHLAPDLAWRYGAAVYLWGDPQDALGILRRGRVDDAQPVDRALLLGWTAAAWWLVGDEAACAECAGLAYEAACAAGDNRALAAAYVALALCADLSGDPAGLQAHYGRALELAEAGGDQVQVLRIRSNLAAALEQQGRLAEALAVLGPAVALAESTGYASSLALALANEGALLHWLGRLDEAAASYQRAVEVYQQMHSRKVAYPLTGLGDLHRLRGQPAQAKAAYTEALRVATEDGNNRQGLVPALAGLARVLADSEPAEAAEAAERALKHASGHWVTVALLARAWVAWHTGLAAEARRDAAAAQDAAARHRDRTGLAQALEVLAVASDDPGPARQALGEALAIWTGSGAELEADRIRVLLGRCPGGDPDQRLIGRLAASRLVAAGVAVPPEPSAPQAPAPVEIRVLGVFTVLVDGTALAPTAWQSKKARDLLRALVARRGRPASREELAELLWGPSKPADQAKVSHRLSVALSTLRAVLDPNRCAPADHFVAASQTNIAVDLGHLTVDVEDLLAQARYGFRLRERGNTAEAHAVLSAADRAYTGEVFADDPYPDWTQPLREEARATHLRVLRALVELSQRDGDVDDIVQYLLRILAVDHYDEQVHRDLVSTLAEAGRHGEASRAFQRYAEAMGELGVPVREVAGLVRPGLLR